VDYRGDYEDFIEDADVAEGFRWSCCDQPGDNEGCKSTKHRADVNVIISDEVSDTVASNKRKAEAELPNPRAEAERRK
jgi:hypothetical protein